MNNNLSAGPTLDDLEGEPDTDSDEQAASNTENTPTETTEPTANPSLTWHCPYCEYTNTDLPNVRNHITESVEGDHKGTSGLSPTRDIIATDENGDVVRRIEGSGERPDEDHHLDHGEKKKLIINAWLENDQERDNQAFASILPVSPQYVQRITKQLETGEITLEDARAEMDWDIRRELRDRLETYYENQQDKPMSLATTDEDDELEHGSKKEQIINAWLLDSDVSYADLDTVLPANKEYIGRVFRDLNGGDIDQDEIENAADRDFQTELMTALENEGVDVEGLPTTTVELDEELEEEADDEPEDQPAYQDTLDNETKKARILNSVLLARDLDVDLTNSEIAGAANSSTQYAQKLTKQIKDDDITDDDLQDAADEDLQDALQQYYEDNDIITPEGGEEAVTIDLENEDDPFENVPVSKREALVNVFLFNPEMSKADAGDLAGASDEYARQTYNGIQSGEYDPDEYLNEDIQSALEELDASGALEAFFSDEDTEHEPETDEVDTEEPTDDTEPEETDVSTEDTQDTPTTPSTNTTDTTDSTDTTRTPGSGGEISTAEIEEIRDTADMLYRQAQYEGDGQNKKAEFIAKELRDRLDTLLETA